jgi:hypothetical protein
VAKANESARWSEGLDKAPLDRCTGCRMHPDQSPTVDCRMHEGVLRGEPDWSKRTKQGKEKHWGFHGFLWLDREPTRSPSLFGQDAAPKHE